MRKLITLVGLLAFSPAVADEAPKFDMSKTVTLTGYEIEALLNAARAEGQAQIISSQATGAKAKIDAALKPTPPPESK